MEFKKVSIPRWRINVSNRSIVREATKQLQTEQTPKRDKAATARKPILWKC